MRPEAEITVSEDGDDDATVTAPGIAAISGPFFSATRYKITRDGPVAKFPTAPVRGELTETRAGRLTARSPHGARPALVEREPQEGFPA